MATRVGSETVEMWPIDDAERASTTVSGRRVFSWQPTAGEEFEGPRADVP